MPDLEQIGRDYLAGADTAKLNDLANSDDGKRIVKMLDAKAVEKAAKAGDTKALQGILTQVLSTAEGKRLAQSISQIMGKK